MGAKEALIPAAFMVIAIVGIALGAMNVNTFMKLDAKSKDKNSTNNFNFSIFIICFSVVALGIAGYFTFKLFKAPAPEEVAAAVAAAKSLPNFQAAQDAVPTTNQIQTLMTPNNVRRAQGAMNAELDKLISSLGETKAMKGQQLQARLQGLIQAAQAMAAASTAAG